MNSKQKRAEIKRFLGLLTDHNRQIFVRMYSHDDLRKDINAVVDDMPAKQLTWALTQCENTYYNLFNILKNA